MESVVIDFKLGRAMLCMEMLDSDIMAVRHLDTVMAHTGNGKLRTDLFDWRSPRVRVSTVGLGLQYSWCDGRLTA